jgi:hypothetical protein
LSDKEEDAAAADDKDDDEEEEEGRYNYTCIYRIIDVPNTTVF